MNTAPGRIEQVAGIVVLGILLIGVYAVLEPFIAVLLWALILSMATWPAYNLLRTRLSGRGALAASVMTVISLAVLVLPLTILGISLSENLTLAAGKLRGFAETGLPPVPPVVASIPIIGDDIAERWTALNDPELLRDAFRENVRPVIEWALSAAGGIGVALGQMTLSILLAWFFYTGGLGAAKQLGHVLRRISGDRADRILAIAGSTLKGVVYGLVGTAVAQGTLAAIGYAVAGVPNAVLLGVITAALSPFPFGVLLPSLPALYWLFSIGETTTAIILLVYMLVIVGGAENVIRPIFIGRGSNLPLLLVFIGILGGVIAFGFLGLFIGPTLLAIAYGLLREWAPTADASSEGVSQTPPDS